MQFKAMIFRVIYLHVYQWARAKCYTLSDKGYAFPIITTIKHITGYHTQVSYFSYILISSGISLIYVTWVLSSVLLYDTCKYIFFNELIHFLFYERNITLSEITLQVNLVQFPFHA
jgi:hypothetical protein